MLGNWKPPEFVHTITIMILVVLIIKNDIIKYYLFLNITIIRLYFIK